MTRIQVLVLLMFAVVVGAISVYSSPAKGIKQVTMADGSVFFLFTPDEMDSLNAGIGGLVEERNLLKSEVLRLRKSCI